MENLPAAPSLPLPRAAGGLGRGEQPVRKGIVVVHGVGTQRQSDTLLDIGQPLLDWVHRWSTASGYHPRFARGHLGFAPVDEGIETDPPHVALDVVAPTGTPILSWVMAETWWSQSVRQPPFGDMLWWSLKHVLRVIWNQWLAVRKRLARVSVRDPKASHLDRLPRVVNFMNSLILLALFIAATVLASGPVLLLALAAQIPISRVQSFIAVHVLRSLLVFNIAQFRTFLEDEIQAANMRARFENTVRWLVRRAGCREVYVIAHSEGAVVAFDALCHPDDPSLVQRVQKLFTLGAGLNKAWLIAPDEQRLRATLPPHIHWVDFWASYDPVPAGPLQPPPGVDIFRPSLEASHKWGPAALVPQSPRDGPVSEEVTGRMDTLTDHGAYWSNDEEVLARVAQEIDAPWFQRSRFWTTWGDWFQLASRRWYRVTLLVIVRLAAMAMYFSNLVAQWGNLDAIGQTTWQRSLAVPGVKGLLDPLLGWVQPALAGTYLPVFNVSAGTAALVLLGMLAMGLVYWAVYQIGRRIAWEPWERRERLDSARLLAIRAVAGEQWPATRWIWLAGIVAWTLSLLLLSATSLDFLRELPPSGP